MVDAAETAEAGNGKASRDQSTIQFPYGDLEDGLAVAKGIMDCGGVPVDVDQLAAAMKQAPNSGNFRLKIATAKIFGLMETVQGKYQLTDLGFAITDAGRERVARVEAFLKVPLYKRVYEEFRNKQLPPRPAALEHAFVGFGVAPKQKERARQAFDRSAQKAGFFDTGGKDRLVRPPGAAGPAAGENGSGSAGASGNQSGGSNQNGERQQQNRDGNGGGRDDLHPFILGLLDELPQPGTVWALEGRVAWLEAAASVFKLIFKGDGKITVESERPPKASREV